MPTSSPQDRRKRLPCPHCGQPILVGANICRFCRASLEPAGGAAPSRGRPHALPPRGHISCPKCGYAGPPAAMDSTAVVLLVVLFLLGIFPALVYGVWRDLTGAGVQCPGCKNRDVLRGGSTVTWGTIAALVLFGLLAIICVAGNAFR